MVPKWGSILKDSDLPRIAEYCQKDAITVAQMYLYFNHKPLLTKEQIEIFKMNQSLILAPSILNWSFTALGKSIEMFQVSEAGLDPS